MASQLRGYIQLYLIVAVLFFVIGVILANLLHQDLVFVLSEVYLWIGLAYVAASTLAWSGVANLYRYSPTLLIGSRTYRQQVVRGRIWEEGRDNRAFVVGLSFGGALMGLGAALYDPVFVLVDVLAVAIVLLLLRALQARLGSKS